MHALYGKRLRFRADLKETGLKVNCSIVLYHASIGEVKKIVDQLRKSELVGTIWLVDNSELMTERFQFMECDYIHGHGNIGYGKGHNIAIDKSLKTNAEYHLVLNSDIVIEEGTIEKIVAWMDQHKDVAQVMPKVLNSDGSDQHLAKRVPTAFDLIHRRLFHSHRCELEFEDQSREYDVEYLSGCFMMLRSQSLRELRERDGYIFDPRFFLYPEDLDLTRRLHQMARTVYLPFITIIHDHRRESYKSLRMTWIHAWNMIKYFWKWR